VALNLSYRIVLNLAKSYILKKEWISLSHSVNADAYVVLKLKNEMQMKKFANIQTFFYLTIIQLAVHLICVKPSPLSKYARQ